MSGWGDARTLSLSGAPVGPTFCKLWTGPHDVQDKNPRRQGSGGGRGGQALGKARAGDSPGSARVEPMAPCHRGHCVWVLRSGDFIRCLRGVRT